MTPVQLVAHEGTLFVSPVLLELQEALKFWHIRQKFREYEYLDKKKGTMVKGQAPDGTEGSWQDLYSISPDAQYLVTHEGLCQRIIDTLAVTGHYDLTYRRTTPLPEFYFGPDVVAGLRPEQVQAVLFSLAATGCRRKGATEAPAPGSGGALISATMSTGKTFFLAALIRAFRDERIVITTYRSSVVRRLYQGLNEILNPEGITVGIMMGGAKAPQQITVSTDAMLQEFDPEEVRVILFDEVHWASADGTSRDLLAYKKAVKIGCSGTIKKHKKRLYIESIFGPIAFELDDKEAEDLGRVAKVKVYAVPVEAGPDVVNASNMVRERHAITRNPHRNEKIRDIVAMIPPDLQTIVYARTQEHLNLLREHYLTGEEWEVYHFKVPIKQKRDIETRIYSGELKRLIATDAFSEGVDTVKMRILVNANWQSAEWIVSQRGGRNRRNDEGKAIGILIDFLDNWEEIARKEQKKLLGGLEPDEAVKTPLFNRAKTRLKCYRDRGWPVIEIERISEIDFSESYTKTPEKTDPDLLPGFG